MIVVDSSAIVAIIFGEPLAKGLEERLAAERIGSRKASTATYIETGAVLAGRAIGAPRTAVARLDRFLSDLSLDLVSTDAEQAHIALVARIEYGRGFGAAAKLNFGDCFSYALAKSLNAPLLYVGNDFDKTDIKPALPVR